jgi:hypothetical protein
MKMGDFASSAKEAITEGKQVEGKGLELNKTEQKMAIKHTPGPWYPVEYADSFIIQDGPYYEDDNVLSYDAFSSIKEDTAKANAKLAAAAPELLVALEGAVTAMKAVTSSAIKPFIDRAESAIKKATK